MVNRPHCRVVQCGPRLLEGEGQSSTLPGGTVWPSPLGGGGSIVHTAGWYSVALASGRGRVNRPHCRVVQQTGLQLNLRHA